MAADLLSFAHTVFGPGFWPGDWVWATMAAGFLIMIFPVLASFSVALIRKGTGNAYNPVTLSVFGVIGVVLALVVPWLMANGISTIFNNAALGGSTYGITFQKTFSTENATVIGTQAEYLGKGPTVYELLAGGSGVDVALNIAKLVVLPALSAFFVILQARAAFRRGPTWPGRMIWLSFVAFLLFSVGLQGNVAFLLWIGMLPAAVLGLIPILVIGAPSWATINRSVQEKDNQPPPQQHPQQQMSAHNQQQQLPPRPPTQQQPPVQQPSQQKPPPYVPEPVPPPYRPDGPLSGQAPGHELLSGSPQPGKLADTPGPMPFPLGGPVPVGGAGAPKPPTRAMASGGGGNSMWTRSGGRFKKIKALGHGGFGTVWLAMDTQLDRTVAVKIAHAPDAETEERMLREARALAAVRHPNCVRVYDIVEDEDGLGIVMEYIEGNALADAVHDNGKLDDLAAARLWVTMAGALSAAHAKGVLHRDIKPSNIMIDPSGMPHLIDFGIARSKGDSTLTKTGMMVGTPDFLAPETAAGSPATPASDAWQLAATVSYALTGEPPRGTRDNPMAALMAAARAERVTHLPNSSVHMRLLAAALGPDPAGRPTLDTVIRQTGGWLSKGGHAEDGPVTKVVKREDIAALDRTKVTAPPAERTKITDPERTKFTDPERTKFADPERTQSTNPPRPPANQQQAQQPAPPDLERTRPAQKKHNPTRRFGM
ncbi:serine/threonine-protein kinase [Kibdelosporangium phytohabitans]|uniref:serine/threonine-protein kinase n=1 Tax=Kibdelosporangium phytohabitans TaxID=860235 RepID=UPI0007C755AE|nr:serine/threonine-protein kinase [Kibdelosporangium phytohabitans]MBE1467664.1 serine/threonine protein kinase [Kibdelosporangium phytohabitans]